jgi:outer membrane protein assembly factor BamB
VDVAPSRPSNPTRRRMVFRRRRARVARRALGLAAFLCFTIGSAAAQVPPEVASNAHQWPLPNKDYASTRAVLADSNISSASVDDLQVAWIHTFEGSGYFGAVATNPLVLDDRVYFQDLESNVYVLHLASGATVWKVDTHDAINFGPTGVAVGYGKVFLPRSPKVVAALDASDGSALWSVDPTRTSSEGMTIQPLVYDGRLYLSTVPGSSVFDFYSGNASGRIHALDVDDGSPLWDFDTVDTMHEMPPHIWNNTAINSGGGAWYPPSIDVAGGTSFWGTGNPAPFAGTPAYPNGSSRLGDNLYTNCILALDHAAGTLDWYHQAKAHDLTDADFMSTPVLATVDIGGQPTNLAIGSGKLGRVIGYDRDTGQVLWNTSVGVHQNDTLDPLPPGDTLVLPGVLGGVETPLAYADGLVFVPVVNLGSLYNPTQSGISNTDPTQGTGELVAIDVTDGSIAWQVAYPAINLGGATVVNDLVFTATFDGMLYAHDRATGSEVWSYDTGESINAWPAVAGDTILFSTRTRLIALRLPQAVPALPHPGAGLLLLVLFGSGMLLWRRRPLRRVARTGFRGAS